MKIIFSFLLSILLISNAFAGPMTSIIHPNTAGSLSDNFARALADAYKDITGHQLVVEAVGGGFQVPGVVAWKQKQDTSIFINTSTVTVFNPKLMQNLPYTDADFSHVTMLYDVGIAWVVRADSPYQTMQDLVKNLPKSKKSFIAYTSHPEITNFHMLAKKYDMTGVEPIKYKGGPEAIAGLLEGSVEVGLLSVAEILAGQIQAGNLRVLGHTSSGVRTIGGVRTPPVSELMGVKQFNGFISVSISPNLDPKVAQQLRKDLIKAVDHPLVKARISQLNSVPVSRGPEHKKAYIADFRAQIKDIEFK